MPELPLGPCSPFTRFACERERSPNPDDHTRLPRFHRVLLRCTSTARAGGFPKQLPLLQATDYPADNPPPPQVGATLVAFLVASATPALTSLHAGGVFADAATHATLMDAVARPSLSALTALSLWRVQRPPAAGARFAALPAPGAHHSIRALAQLPALRRLHLSQNSGSGVERAPEVLLSAELVDELVELTVLQRLVLNQSIDVPLRGLCRLLAGLPGLTHLSTHGPLRLGMEADASVTHAGARR